MSKSKIEWTDYTFNPWWGCVKVSEGCKNCYAETMSKRWGRDIWGKDANRMFMYDGYWSKPLKWNAKAKKEGVRYKVFCGSMCDVFEQPDNFRTLEKLDNSRKRLGKLIKETPHLDWLLLTKRPEIWAYSCFDLGFSKHEDYYHSIHKATATWNFPDNVWLGVSVENQKQADLRIPELLKIPAKIRFLSMEPLLGAVNLVQARGLTKYISGGGVGNIPLTSGLESNGIDWIIVGGESGLKARPMDRAWVASLCNQAMFADIPFFMKQLGGHPNKRSKLEDLPEDLRIREFPLRYSK